MQRTLLMRIIPALLAVGALALAGCGGDDGVAQSTHDQTVQELEAERQARMDAETRAEEAEMDADAVEEAEAETEEERQARMDAEEKARMEEEARKKAEADAAKELMDVQAAAAAAAMAAKTASDTAATDSKAAMDATANIATLQTGEMSKMMAYDAKMAADGAMKAYMAAKMASETAAAATDISAATTAKDMAEAEQMKAEKYAMTADEKSMGAMKYAAMELMIDGYMYSVGESSIDARMGTLTTGTAEVDRTITGLQETMAPKRTTKMVDGAAFVPRATSTVKDTPYEQAIAAGMIDIGKVLDTTDDKARLTLIDSYQGKKSVRVFANAHQTGGVTNLLAGGTQADGSQLITGTVASPVGMYYHANHYSEDGSATEPLDTDLEYHDRVTVTDAKGVMIYRLTNSSPDSPPAPIYARRIQTVTHLTGEYHTYRQVDIMAPSAFNEFPTDVTNRIKDAQVKVDLPAPVEYSHINFGVWNTLGMVDHKAGDTQKVADLGIAFVQSIGDGMAETQIAGTATFDGDWTAAVQSMSGSDDIMVDSGAATLTANFDKDTFKGVLTDLATLEGALSGNEFSGMKATAITHDNLDSSATFKGTFSGGIYGSEGSEAGGIFDFASESGGAFRGAFGGARDTD